MYTDKSLKCVDCGAEFVFSSGEQERFAQLGFTNEPKRCAPCRAAKKATGNGRRSAERTAFAPASAKREMSPAVCADCRTETQVPFSPRGDRPVYCSDCFSRRR